MDSLLKKTSTNDPPTDAVASEVDFYRIVRGQIEHEDNLVGSRISWFVTSQSFLFSAYAILSSGLPANPTPAYLSGKHTMLTIVPIVGITNALLILLAILSGVMAMANLRSLYWKHANETPAPLPPIQGSNWTRMMGQAAPVLLPVLFMAVWGFLLLRRLF